MKHRLILLALGSLLLVPSSAHATNVCGIIYTSGGGTSLGCTDADATSLFVGSYGSDVASGEYEAAVSASTAGLTGTYAASPTRCDFSRNRKEAKSVAHIHLATTRLDRYWCWRGKHIVHAPAANLGCQITDAGSILGWSGCDIVNRVSYCEYWNGDSCGSHYKAVTWQLRRCIPSPWGCIQVSQKQITRATRVFAGGAAHRW